VFPAGGITYANIRGGNIGQGWPKNDRVDAGSFLGKMRTRTGRNFDIPTEAQWEYACRAGTQTAFWFGDDPNDLHRFGNYRDKSSGLRNGKGWWAETDMRNDDGFKRFAPVGSFPPNPWGLYDMHGNVKEWCRDWLNPIPSVSPDANSEENAIQSKRVIRGGGRDNVPISCRSAMRWGYGHHVSHEGVGFRLMLNADATNKTE
jgi:formylglycine-generating enzyme required for sulfatase activity